MAFLTRESIRLQKQISQPIVSFLCRRISSLTSNPDPTQNPTPTSLTTSFLREDPLYRSLFSKLRAPSSLSEAQKLHAVLIVNGFLASRITGGVLASQLVKVYAGFGCSQDALILFDGLPHKTNLAWNAILRGFIDAGQFSKAIEFYHMMMLGQGVAPDNFTYPLVLKAYSGLHDVEGGRRVRDQILMNETTPNIQRNIHVQCALIDMFAKCGSLNEARLIFEGIHEKDLACWSAMICGSVQNGECFEAIYLFNRMRLEGLRSDAVVLAAMFPACGRLENKKMGMTLQGCAIRSGFEGDLYVSNALMDMYCKCGDTHSAYCVFCRMENKDLVSWSTMIAGYSQNWQYNESLQLYLTMKDAGVRTSAIIAASILPGLANLKLLNRGKEMHNYILKHGYESDIVIGSALVDMYANCGSIRNAEQIFGLMLDEDITIWNSMIAGYSLNGEIDSSFMIFRRIWDFNLRPNSITLISILPTCTRTTNLRHGKEVHGYAIRSSLGTTISVGNSLIDMYCKCGCLGHGENVFRQMKGKNIVSYNTIISAYGRHGLGEHAYRIFEQMKAKNMSPNKITFTALLAACSHAGLVERGRLLYNSMVYDYKITPGMEHYSCMVDLIGRAGYIDDAYSLICTMPMEPDMNVLGSFLGACRIHNKVELAEIVRKHVLQKIQKDSGHYILLSNIYASTGRWIDASKFRMMIKQNGLEKKPGSSWFQTASDTHVFHARDKIQLESDEIQVTLDSLLAEMRTEGYRADPRFSSDDVLCDFNEISDFHIA